MTVAELISKLREFPQDAYVTVTDSSCCGCNYGDISEIVLKDGDVFIDGNRFSERLDAAQTPKEKP